MEKKSTYSGAGKVTHDYSATRKSFVVPAITRTETIDGTRYYFTDTGRQFVADTFDRVLKPPRGKIKQKMYKGKNPSRLLAISQRQ